MGPKHTPTEFDVFAMVAPAGIGDMPDTITDRVVNIAMRRRAPGETVSQFRLHYDGPPLEALRGRLAGWAATRVEDLAKAHSAIVTVAAYGPNRSGPAVGGRTPRTIVSVSTGL